MAADRAWLAENRYRAVLEVKGGAHVTEVAASYGVSRQSVHAWLRRYEDNGLDGLQEKSRRPHTSPARLAADVEALVCEVRRANPRWGARRISHELAQRGTVPAPSRATVHRVLSRNGMVIPQEQRHKRKYRRWQRAAPMHLWQLDIVGGLMLADGRECKILTGIDDHSRFVVASAVLAVPNGRAVCEAFAAAMRRYGVPSEVLTDNGKQFTGRHNRPEPVEVMFERVCRENGITARHTKPRSPTTTGKIERFHRTLREEFLGNVAPFQSPAAAQQALEEWVSAYNHARPHQALQMAVPASLFRPNGPVRGQPEALAGAEEVSARAAVPAPAAASPPALALGVAGVPAKPEPAAGALEFERLVPPKGTITLVTAGQSVTLTPALAGRTVTIWASQRTIHVLLDGHAVRTTASRLTAQDMRWLAMRGARPAGPAPAAPAMPRTSAGRLAVPVGQAIAVERMVSRDGLVHLEGREFQVSNHLSGRTVTLRLDGHLMHAIADGVLAGTWPCPVSTGRLASLRGAVIATGKVPPPPLPAGSTRVQRKIGDSGRIMVANQRLKLGKRNAGKLVTVVIEDTCFRVLHGEEELAVRARNNTQPLGRVRVIHKRDSQDQPSKMS